MAAGKSVMIIIFCAAIGTEITIYPLTNDSLLKIFLKQRNLLIQKQFFIYFYIYRERKEVRPHISYSA